MTNRIVDYVYNPFQIPSPEELRRYYKRVEFDYNSQVKPYWVLHDNKVWRYKKKTGGKTGAKQVTIENPFSKALTNPVLESLKKKGGTFFLNIPCHPEDTYKPVMLNLGTKLDEQADGSAALSDGESEGSSTDVPVSPTGVSTLDTPEIVNPAPPRIQAKPIMLPFNPAPPKIQAKPIMLPVNPVPPSILDNHAQQVDYLIHLLKAFKITPRSELYILIQEGVADLQP
jgi:hypothetical protein